jgi:hypothetical protein
MPTLNQLVEVSCAQAGMATYSRRKYGNVRLRTYDREEERNERLNSLYVKYAERIIVLKARITILLGNNIEQPVRMLRLKKQLSEQRTRLEQVLQGNLPKRKYRLLRVS